MAPYPLWLHCFWIYNIICYSFFVLIPLVSRTQKDTFIKFFFIIWKTHRIFYFIDKFLFLFAVNFIKLVCNNICICNNVAISYHNSFYFPFRFELVYASITLLHKTRDLLFRFFLLISVWIYNFLIGLFILFLLHLLGTVWSRYYLALKNLIGGYTVILFEDGEMYNLNLILIPTLFKMFFVPLKC